MQLAVVLANARHERAYIAHCVEGELECEEGRLAGWGLAMGHALPRRSRRDSALATLSSHETTPQRWRDGCAVRRLTHRQTPPRMPTPNRLLRVLPLAILSSTAPRPRQ